MPLNEVELAALDLLIAYKKSNMAPAGFIDVNVNVNNLGDVAVAAAAAAVVTAAVAAATTVAGVAAGVPVAAQGVSLQELIQVRDAAIKQQP